MSQVSSDLVQTPYFFPAKLLLLGEHTVIQGSQALAMPLWAFGGHWEYSSDRSKQYDLPNFVEYLQKLKDKGQIVLDTEGVQKELSEGLFFNSNIPRGYGAGSSGALVAAIYEKFAHEKTTDLVELKYIFGIMESYFHGSSSGFDPLISYVKKMVLIKRDKTMVSLEPIHNDVQIFLLDTHITRKAQNLIAIFADRCKTPQYNEMVVNDLVPNIDNAITAYLHNMPHILFEAIHHISYFQYRFFPESIPLAYKNVWLEGLSGDIYKLKLCGAGGGGFILGFCKNIDHTQHLLSKSGFAIIPLHQADK